MGIKFKEVSKNTRSNETCIYFIIQHTFVHTYTCIYKNIIYIYIYIYVNTFTYTYTYQYAAQGGGGNFNDTKLWER